MQIVHHGIWHLYNPSTEKKIKKKPAKEVKPSIKESKRNEKELPIIELIRHYKNKVKKVHYNKYKMLEVVIKDVSEEDARKMFNSIHDGYIRSKEYSKCTKHLIIEITENVDEKYKVKKEEFLKLLNINPSKLNKDYEYEKEISRIEKIQNELEQLYKEDYSIKLTRMLNAKRESISIKEILTNFSELVNEGMGCYVLVNKSNNKEKIKVFVLDGWEEIYNDKDGLFEDVESRICNKNQVYKFESKKDYIMFLYTIYKHNVPITFVDGTNRKIYDIKNIIPEYLNTILI